MLFVRIPGINMEDGRSLSALIAARNAASIAMDDFVAENAPFSNHAYREYLLLTKLYLDATSRVVDKYSPMILPCASKSLPG